MIRSPKQVRDRSDELKCEVESDDAKMAEVVHGLGPALVARHGVRGAAERIAQLYGTLSVDAVSLALLHLSGVTGGDKDGEEMDAGGDGSEASEAATEFDDDSPVYVGYIRGDRSEVNAQLRDETVRNGVAELHLFLVESGIKKRVTEERVIRQWPVEGDDDEVASVAASVAQSSAVPTSQVALARAASVKKPMMLDYVISKAKTLQGLGVSDSDVLALCKVTAANVGCEWVSAAESVRRVLRTPVNAAAAMSRARSVSDVNASVANASRSLTLTSTTAAVREEVALMSLRSLALALACSCRDLRERPRRARDHARRHRHADTTSTRGWTCTGCLSAAMQRSSGRRRTTSVGSRGIRWV